MKRDSKWIVSWQKRMKEQPKIYHTFSYKFQEPTGNYYESKEAAQLEVDWAKNGGEHLQIFSFHIHSLELSKERWSD